MIALITTPQITVFQVKFISVFLKIHLSASEPIKSVAKIDEKSNAKTKLKIKIRPAKKPSIVSNKISAAIGIAITPKKPIPRFTQGFVCGRDTMECADFPNSFNAIRAATKSASIFIKRNTLTMRLALAVLVFSIL